MSFAPLTIVVFGDSITEASSGMPEADRWPVLVEAGLRQRLAPAPVRVVNAGAGGNTSREGLARMDRDVLAHRPDLVLVEFGGNDATLEPERHVSLEEFRMNLDIMKHRLDFLGSCRMVLMTFPPVVDQHHAWRDAFESLGGQDAFIEQYREAAREFGAACQVPVFDLDHVIRKNVPGHILPDGVHLTAAGNRAVAEALGPFLIALTRGPGGEDGRDEPAPTGDADGGMGR